MTRRRRPHGRARPGAGIGLFLLFLLSLLSAGCARKGTAPSPPAALDNALFEDVTDRAGLRFRHENGAEAGKL
jgi:hypothetical protein